ncbi:hypothetical protein [Chryseolinea soli]|uniref:hypothetical protein n=1 Tax=Chryseolinea soli TaxID=2321403 RepID=UPI00135C7239|nr:hypothetical protein [Chryseolinea soli]
MSLSFIDNEGGIYFSDHPKPAPGCYLMTLNRDIHSTSMARNTFFHPTMNAPDVSTVSASEASSVSVLFVRDPTVQPFTTFAHRLGSADIGIGRVAVQRHRSVQGPFARLRFLFVS